MPPSKARASKVRYHVFLSFSGDDTRHDFTDFLHQHLVQAKHRVFRDADDIEVGDEIGKTLLQAIDNSKIYIPIISQTYPDRKWCLIELERMMINVSRSKGQKKILPIFFEVKAGDVKHRTPQPKNLPVIPRAWKEALAKVGQIKGWKVQKGQSQTQIVDSVVQTVLEKLGKKEESQTKYWIEPDDLTKSVEDSFNRADMCLNLMWNFKVVQMQWDDKGRGRSLSRGSRGRRWRSLSINRKEYTYLEKCSGGTGRKGRSEIRGRLTIFREECRYNEEYSGSTGRSGSSSRSSSSSSIVPGSSSGSSRRSSRGSSERKSSEFSFAALLYSFCTLCSNRSPVARSLDYKRKKVNK